MSKDLEDGEIEEGELPDQVQDASTGDAVRLDLVASCLQVPFLALNSITCNL